jgi:hypothetical protein
MPFTKVGSHRRILFSDVLTYRHQQDEMRRQALTKITYLAEDEGIYD